MADVPFRLQYTLSCWQRLVPHCRLCGTGFAALAVVVFLFLFVAAIVAAWSFKLQQLAAFAVSALLVLVLCRKVFAGLVDVLLVPVRRMDVIVEENAAGILVGDERWYLFLDGITDLRKLSDDIWTVQFFNGWVLHIPVSAIQDDQIAHLRSAMERGRTPKP